MTSIASATARDLAEAWLRADPDPTTSVQTRALLEADGPELDAVFAERPPDQGKHIVPLREDQALVPGWQLLDLFDDACHLCTP